MEAPKMKYKEEKHNFGESVDWVTISSILINI